MVQGGRRRGGLIGWRAGPCKQLQRRGAGSGKRFSAAGARLAVARSTLPPGPRIGWLSIFDARLCQDAPWLQQRRGLVARLSEALVRVISSLL